MSLTRIHNFTQRLLRSCLVELSLCLPMLLPSVAAGTPAVNLEFPKPDADFAAYATATDLYIEKFQLGQRGVADVHFNSPFEVRAKSGVLYRGRFLLIHGLNDSPYVWHDVAIELAARGFDVRAILLPGHGTTPEAMLAVSYREWLQAARLHLANWQGEGVPVYLGGFSLGGVISTILAMENSQVAGLLLFSPAWHSQLNHLLRWAGLYSRFRPWVFGGMILEDNPARYNSIPINSAAQYYRTTQYLKRRLRHRRLNIPVMVVVSADDSVVDIDYARAFFQDRFTSPRRALILYGNDTSTVLEPDEIRRVAHYPELRILNQSHLSVLNSADNPHYGDSRQQLICNGNEYEIFFACMRSAEHWFGAQHTPSPDAVAVARTTYNPDFNFVFQIFDRVFQHNQ